jgi:hypothetical protein
MKWYIEEETKELRETLEKEVFKWPKVTSKRMMGCPCYLANGKMFAGMVTNGIVITKLNCEERKELKKKYPANPFRAGTRTIRKWIHLILEPDDLMKVMPYIKASYDTALKTSNPQ